MMVRFHRSGRAHPVVTGVALVLCVMIAGLFVAGRYVASRTPEPSQPSVAEAEGPEERVVLDPESLTLADLKIEAPVVRPMRSLRKVTGQIVPDPSGLVRVTSRVEGRVIRLLVAPGDSVRAGQTLAIVESERLHGAQVAYQLATRKTALARQMLEQRRRLAALGEYARPQLEQARARLNAVEAEVRQAEGAVALARSSLDEVEAQLRALHAALERARIQAQLARSRAERAEMLYREELMARQDWEQAQAEAAQAQAALQAAEAEVAQGEAKRSAAATRVKEAQAAHTTALRQRELAEQALRRAEAVYQGNYYTHREVMEAHIAYEQARIEEDGALDDVQLLGGQPGDLHRAPVVAPIAGRVAELLVTVGENVLAERPLLTLLNPRVVRAQFDVFARDAAFLKAGQTVFFTAETLPGRVFRGTVSRIEDRMDPQTRTVRVQCTVPNTAGWLKPGAFVTGTLVTRQVPRALVVPQEAVQQVDGRNVVYVPTGAPGTFRPVAVRIGQRQPPWVEILEGLKPTDRIVTRNAFLLKSQMMKSELADE
ncbi:MAG: efflux RND transporter periplasmic adaptor subunit [Chloroherpetonaceae bacterium]|nr:efflux RND transporter periplasmic adaptor subunit [Chloroherpetonaceae bacterium]